ncbi:MAG TPA: Clp protease N-terminal domain-containing protein [Streptosporangiaceae bacterium]|nr:Clp protease N-terminal domain-containing protein [Streptosporangiaceae bacterium]
MYLDQHEHDGDEAQKDGANMFERFTDQARRVLALAQDEARARNCRRVGTEHILLGLISERDGFAAVALESLGIGAEAVRRQIEKITGQHPEPSGGYAQYTMRAKKALDLSRREALQLGHNHIGTEHILLSLIREGEGPAAQVLLELGADLGRVREQVLLLLGDGGQDDESDEAPGARAGLGAGAGIGTGASAGVGESKLLAEMLRRIEEMDSRLASVEQRLGTGPDVRDLDQQILQARRDKESAVGAEDYENAAMLRNRERQLLADKASRQNEWATAHLDLPALADKVSWLTDEVARLRGLLRQKGIEPRDGAA